MNLVPSHPIEVDPMNYFVTGATGFLGRFLLERLLARPDAEVYCLVRPASRRRFESQLQRFGDAAARVHVLEGDITREGLVSDVDRQLLIGRVDHAFHLAAVYDMGMSDEVADRVNEQGTREVVCFVNGLGGRVCLHHVSSIAVAGPFYDGVFREGHFDEGQELGHPYYRSKFAAEKVVREECRVPYRVYRPGVVVGHSQTGAIDKADGPYYFFATVRRLSWVLPRLVPLLMVEGGRMPIVPVDYVVDAIDAIAHRRRTHGRVFHLVPTRAPSVGELVERLFAVAGGPPVLRVAFAPAARLANGITRVVGRLVPVSLARWLTDVSGVPVSVFSQMFTQTVYDDEQARTALAGTGIRCPDFADHVEAMWRGWSDHHGGRPPEASPRTRAVERTVEPSTPEGLPSDSRLLN